MADMSVSKDIHVVSLADDKYAQHLGVTFASLLKNKAPSTSIQLYVVSTGLTEMNRSKLEKTVERFETRIHFIKVDETPFKEFQVSRHFGRETYSRLAIANLLPASISKVICLDSDVVVTGDLTEMWQTDLKGNAIAAVSDQGAAFRCEALQIPEGIYFNAGIYVMNLTKWREEAISEKIIDYIQRNAGLLDFLDQDAMNALLYDDWLALSPKWNVHTHMVESKVWDGSESPVIIHYTGSLKPWYFDSIHPYKREYYKYLKLTEWKGYRAEINLSRIKMKSIRLVKRKLRPMKPTLKKIFPKPIYSLLRKVKLFRTVE